MVPSISILSQLLLAKVKMTAARHKKKLILATVLVLAGYVAKKKMTLGHILSFVDFLTRTIQALPLPDAPKLRTLAEYEHPNTVPLKAISETMNLEELKRKISSKEAGWEDLKQAITTGTVLSLLLYNTNSLAFLVQNKYREEFITLESSNQYEQCMYEIRKRFVEDITFVFNHVKNVLNGEFMRVELTRMYEVEEIEEIFERMVKKVLEYKFDVEKEKQYTCMNKMGKESINLFTSPYEYIEQKSSTLAKVGTTIFKLMGGFFSPGITILPTPELTITTERFAFVKISYVQPLKKAISSVETEIEWPNKQAKELFALVVEELQFLMTSINFSTLLKAYARYNLKILGNRIRLLFRNKQKNKMKFSELLPMLNKILMEEFLKQNLMEQRDRFHSNELRKALKVVSELSESSPPPEPDLLLPETETSTSWEEHILREIELKESFQYLEREVELKLYNERSGIVMRPKTGGNNGGKGEGNEVEELKKMLNMLGQSEVLNDQE